MHNAPLFLLSADSGGLTAGKTFAEYSKQFLPDSVIFSILVMLAAMVAAAAVIVLVALILIYAERKVSGHFQLRLGPMRVGWHGTIQACADACKLLFKEDNVPTGADKLLHTLAPGLSFLATVLMFLVLPMGQLVQFADLNIGLLFLSAVSGFGVLGLLLGGWSSNNKWSMLGAIRAGAQLISYELTLTLCMLVVALFVGSLSLRDVVASQQDGWWIWRAHGIGVITFVLFIIASTAELNRTPFDLPEGESELIGGFHTEYSGLRFGYFFLAEFLNMFVAAAVAATLFLGGWMPFHIGGLDGFNAIMDYIPGGVWFAAKSAFLVWVFMWFRWTFPRLRIDQMMRLEWKILMPIGFVNLFLASIVVLFGWYFFPIINK